MDENRPTYGLQALGRSGSSSALRLPGRDPFPGVDDHLVQPEVTRDEIIGGRRVVASPAKRPHATQHTRLDYVLDAHVAPGYEAATDLLTRHDAESDFATDTCVFKEAVDPATGDRYLEEIAFEVVSKQNEGDVTEKALRMHRRGVRRIFGVWVKSQRVCEWSPESQSWRRLEPGMQIEDPCLVRPLAVSALLDAALADNAVAEALEAKGNPVIQRLKAQGKAEGRAEGKAEGKAEGIAESILRLVAARGVAVSPAQQQEILGCRDLDRLNRWLLRAAQASSTAEVIAEG
jgi:Putative restriction endonuclease